MADKTYEGKRASISFDLEKCIHSRECIMGAPEVFKESGKPWIDPDGADPSVIAQVVSRCPSGALHMQAEGMQEPVAVRNIVRVNENGPLSVRAQLNMAGDTVTRRVLCRCGATSNQPYCDGSHRQVGFQATGEPPSDHELDAPSPPGELSVTPTENGPFHVTGGLEVVAASGRVVRRCSEAWLCRCGHSSDKPFCDGTHEKVGFKG